MIPYDFSLLEPRPRRGTGIPQNTIAWLEARRGRITASDRAYTMLYGRPATIARMMDAMAEELKKPVVEGPKFAATEHGHAYEERGVREYGMARLATGKIVVNPGMFVHREFDIASATPDFFEGKDGTGQVKCPLKLENHEKLLQLGVKAAEWKYYVQVQFEYFITQRPKIIFVSFHPDAKPREQLHYEIVPIDEAMQKRFRERLTEINHMLVNNERPSYETEFEGIPELF